MAKSFLSALVAARTVKLGGPDPDAIVYLSDQAHSSVAKGLRVIGFPSSQLRSIPVDDSLRMDVAALHRQVHAVHGGEALELFREIARFKNDVGHAHGFLERRAM